MIDLKEHTYIYKELKHKIHVQKHRKIFSQKYNHTELELNSLKPNYFTQL